MALSSALFDARAHNKTLIEQKIKMLDELHDAAWSFDLINQSISSLELEQGNLGFDPEEQREKLWKVLEALEFRDGLNPAHADYENNIITHLTTLS